MILSKSEIFCKTNNCNQDSFLFFNDKGYRGMNVIWNNIFTSWDFLKFFTILQDFKASYGLTLLI